MCMTRLSRGTVFHAGYSSNLPTGLCGDTSSSYMEGPKVSPISSPFGGEKQQWEKELDESPADLAPDSGSSTAALGQVFLQCWPVLGAIFFSGTFFVLAFPFFPYVPSDGTFGHELPRVSLSTSLHHHPLITSQHITITLGQLRQCVVP